MIIVDHLCFHKFRGNAFWGSVLGSVFCIRFGGFCGGNPVLFSVPLFSMAGASFLRSKKAVGVKPTAIQTLTVLEGST